MNKYEKKFKDSVVGYESTVANMGDDIKRKNELITQLEKDVQALLDTSAMLDGFGHVRELISKEVESKRNQIDTAQRSINHSSGLIKDKQSALSVLYSVCAHDYIYEYTCRNKGDMSRCSICGDIA